MKKSIFARFCNAEVCAVLPGHCRIGKKCIGGIIVRWKIVWNGRFAMDDGDERDIGER